jgi:hypothetical protein
MNLGDTLGQLSIGPRPHGPRIHAGQPPVETRTGDLQHPAQSLDAEGATVILDELEAAHPADGAFSDPMAETEQFTPDAPVSPSRVLSGQPDHQIP